MDYEERLPPEHINTSDEHPLKELFVLLLGSVLILGAGLLIVHQSAGWLARQIPVETEQALFAQAPATDKPSVTDKPASALNQYLNQRLQAIAQHMALPEGMSVKLSVMVSDQINAFASPGSHMVLMTGLLERLPHENALSMLIAHELAHLAHRDPISSYAEGAAISLSLAMLGAEIDFGAAEVITEMTLLGFSRDMEDRADLAALQALGAVYGHTAGAADLFRVLGAAGKMPGSISLELPSFLSTHPALTERIELIPERSQQAGFGEEGQLTPLPTAYKSWIKALKAAPESNKRPSR